MQEKLTQPTLEPIEVEVIEMLYGVGNTSSGDNTPLTPQISETEVAAIERSALRKLRNLRIESLSQFRRAG